MYIWFLTTSELLLVSQTNLSEYLFIQWEFILFVLFLKYHVVRSCFNENEIIFFTLFSNCMYVIKIFLKKPTYIFSLAQVHSTVLHYFCLACTEIYILFRVYVFYDDYEEINTLLIAILKSQNLFIYVKTVYVCLSTTNNQSHFRTAVCIRVSIKK